MTIQLSRRAFVGAASVGASLVAGAGRAAAAPAVAVEPPVFGPAPGVALLSRNENPYGPAPSAIQAMADAAAKGCYYADGGLTKLTAMIAERFGVAPEQVVGRLPDRPRC